LHRTSHTKVLDSIEDALLQAGYFVASHRHKKELLHEYLRLLLSGAVEGVIAADLHIGDRIILTVAV
jgi:DNA-binding LacI/PurR family transcriptional regulator